MKPALVRLVASFAILCGVLFIYGFLMVDRAGVSTLDDPKTKVFTVIITLNAITPRYAWVQVSGCAAEVVDDGDIECAGFWDRKSVQETRVDQRQYPFPWGRYVPPGKLLIVATAYDAHWQVLARGRAVVMR